MKNTKNRGFASMDPEKQKAIAQKGGRSLSQNKEHMSAIGKLGGRRSGEVRGKKEKDNIKSISEIATMRDGGTQVMQILFESGIKKEVHIDYRIMSTTKGEVFDVYPERATGPSELSAAVKEYLKANPL